MSSNDVMKVHLSAEGIQEVMAALQKVQAGVKRTSDATKGATDALGSLGTLFAAQQLASFAKSALDSADQLFKMSQKTGVAVEELSVFSYVAQQADVSQESLTKGFGKLAKSLDSLNAGEASTVEAFQRIGLSAEDLKGLSLDKALLKIAEAQAKFEDGAGKAAVSMAIFGKSGTEMIPMLNDLANGGFQNAKTKMQELGLVISADMAKASQDFNDSMERLEMAAKGATVKVAQGMLPGLTAAVDGLATALAEMPGAARNFSASFVAVGTVATAAAVGVRALSTALVGLGPAGLAFVAISALIAGLLALKAAEAEAQAQAVKANEQQRDRVRDGAALVEAYKKESQQLEKGSLSAKERKGHEEKLKKIKEDLIKLSPSFQDSLDKEKDGYKAAREELEKKLKVDREDLELKKKRLAAEIETAKGVVAAQERSAKDQMDRFLKPGFAPARQLESQAMGAGISAQLLKSAKAELSALEAQMKALSEPDAAPTTETKLKVTEKGNASAGRAESAAMAAEAKRLTDDQKQALDAYAALVEDAYAQGLLSLQDYLAERRGILEAGTEQEIALLLAQIKAEEKAREGLKTSDDKAKADTKIADLRAQIDLKRGAGEIKLQELQRKGEALAAAAAQDQLKLEAELEEAKGRVGESAIKAVQAEYAEKIRLAKTPEAQAVLQELGANAVSRKRLEGTQQTGDTAQKNLNNALGAIELQQQSGALSDTQAVQAQISAYEQWIAVMYEAAGAQRILAQQTCDKGLIADADAQLLQIDGLRQKLHELKNPLLELKKVGKDAIQNGLQDFLMSLGDTATSVGDKFRALGASIAQAMMQEASARLAKIATNAAFSAFGFDAGGYTGPGARLEPAGIVHRGEYVFSQGSVRALGVDTLERLHQASKRGVLSGLSVPKGLLPGYADGGMVTPGPSPIPVSGNFSHEVGLTLDKGLLVQFFDSPEGAKIVLKHASANSKKMNRALGR